MEKRKTTPRQPAFTIEDIKFLTELYNSKDKNGYPITITEIVRLYNKQTGQRRTQTTIETRFKLMIQNGSLKKVDRSPNIKREKESWISRVVGS